MFEKMQQNGHEKVLFCYDQDTGLQSIIAIHSTVLGPALGGVRMYPYKTSDEAITDVLRLSKAMTYKNAMAGIDFGGGKAIIIGNPKVNKTVDLLQKFGSFVGSLGGEYYTAIDVGIDSEDLKHIRFKSPWVLGTHRVDTAKATARGIIAAMRACTNDDLRGIRVAVQGVGKVGSNLVELLVYHGAVVTIADIDTSAVVRMHDDYGVAVVSPEDIYSVECDIFSPCSFGGVLNDDTIPLLKCPMVIGGANNQLLDDRHDLMIRDMAILYIPDYIVNSGGVIYIAGEYLLEDEAQTFAKIDNIFTTVCNIMNYAGENDMTVLEAANYFVEMRINHGQPAASFYCEVR